MDETKGAKKIKFKTTYYYVLFSSSTNFHRIKHIIDNHRFIRNNHRVSNSFSRIFYELSLWNSAKKKVGVSETNNLCR